MDYQRGQLKRQVKGRMSRTRPHPMLITALFFVTVWAGSYLIQELCGLVLGGGMGMAGVVRTLQWIDQAEDLREMEVLISQMMGMMAAALVGSVLAGLLSGLWSGLMNVSYKGYSLSMARGENPRTGKLFCAFPRFGSVLLTRLLVGVFTFLWELLFMVVGLPLLAITIVTQSLGVTTAVMVIFMIFVIVGTVWVTLRYAMTDYILLDQGLSGREAIRASKEMMRGNKGRLWVLEFSFIGWWLLEAAIILAGVLVAVLLVGPQFAYYATRDAIVNPFRLLASMGQAFLVVFAAWIGSLILSLWVTPYSTGAEAAFYDLLQSRNPGKPEAEEVFPLLGEPLEAYEETTAPVDRQPEEEESPAPELPTVEETGDPKPGGEPGPGFPDRTYRGPEDPTPFG